MTVHPPENAKAAQRSREQVEAILPGTAGDSHVLALLRA